MYQGRLRRAARLLRDAGRRRSRAWPGSRLVEVHGIQRVRAGLSAPRSELPGAVPASGRVPARSSASTSGTRSDCSGASSEHPARHGRCGRLSATSRSRPSIPRAPSPPGSPSGAVCADTWERIRSSGFWFCWRKSRGSGRDLAPRGAEGTPVPKRRHPDGPDGGPCARGLHPRPGPDGSLPRALRVPRAVRPADDRGRRMGRAGHRGLRRSDAPRRDSNAREPGIDEPPAYVYDIW